MRAFTIISVESFFAVTFKMKVLAAGLLSMVGSWVCASLVGAGNIVIFHLLSV